MKKITIFSVLTLIMASFVFAQEGHHHMTGEGNNHMVAKREDVGICPVMGGEASRDYSYAYEGKTYYFCCPACIEQFSKDPQRYISKIKEINLEAYQFGFSPERMVVKKGDIVKIFAISRDVTHGIYIKEYDINVAVKKGEVTKIEFMADKTGKFDIVCSIYCGPGHRDMRATLVVEE